MTTSDRVAGLHASFLDPFLREVNAYLEQCWDKHIPLGPHCQSRGRGNAAKPVTAHPPPVRPRHQQTDAPAGDAPQRVSLHGPGTRAVMHGQHARPASNPFRPAPSAQMPPSGQVGSKHSRRSRISGRLRRRILVYRAIDFLSARIPDASGPGEECLLLVHIRQVVGQVRYRICPNCARGVITAVIIDERFHGAGLGARALSHLRSRHPTTAWRSTVTRRTARDLLRRMRFPTITYDTSCDHTRRPLFDPTPAAS
ncbi:hypothetical protein ACFVRB_33235 [Streptomyces nojiriensis]|uniref:hypothetical protein n=1 Tax=Streptomyces nojiriensis TaxID=66374 RepID=UPI0036D96A98